jgi:hypothetical protein
LFYRVFEEPFLRSSAVTRQPDVTAIPAVLA